MKSIHREYMRKSFQEVLELKRQGHQFSVYLDNWDSVDSILFREIQSISEWHLELKWPFLAWNFINWLPGDFSGKLHLKADLKESAGYSPEEVLHLVIGLRSVRPNAEVILHGCSFDSLVGNFISSNKLLLKALRHSGLYKIKWNFRPIIFKPYYFLQYQYQKRVKCQT